MADPVARIDRITKRFASARGPLTAVDAVGAEIEGGRVTGLVGPDGAGKTTLIRLIAGLLLPDAGTGHRRRLRFSVARRRIRSTPSPPTCRSGSASTRT